MAGRKKAGENTVLSSMTGFARGNGHDERFNWTWELKSVNSKGLDIRCRTPSGFDALEGPARAAAATRFTRGNLTMTLQLKPVAGSASVTVNRELLEHLLEVVRNYQDAPGVLPPRLDGLLGIRGIIEPMEPEESENEVAARADAVLQSLEIVLDDLYAARGEEGERLGSILRNHVEEIENLVGSAMDSAAAQPEVLAARLSEQLSQILQISPPIAGRTIGSGVGDATREGRCAGGTRPSYRARGVGQGSP